MVNQQVRPAGPFTATGYQSAENSALTRLEGSVEDLDLHIELNGQGQLTVLLFNPAQEVPEAAESFEEIEERLDELSGEARLLVVQDGERLLAVGADQSGAMGSVFKLWVLVAVVEAVEQTVGTNDHHDPELWEPFLTTRDMFHLRWGDAELGEVYSQADEERRREILDGLSEQELVVDVADVVPDDGVERTAVIQIAEDPEDYLTNELGYAQLGQDALEVDPPG